MGRRAWLQKTRARDQNRNKTKQYKLELPYLPDEILILILGRLCSEDQIRFRAVCRRWHALERVKPRPPQTPWLFVYKSELTAYVLYNPLTRKSLIFESPLQITCLISEHCSDDWIDVLAMHSGWLLMACSCSFEAPFLYNPFTRRTCHLPTVKKGFDYYTFRYCPVERRFTVYAVEFESSFVMTVHTWRSGDRGWKQDKLSGTHFADWERTGLCSLICGDGVLYCYFASKEVVVAFRHSSHGFDWIEVQLAGTRLRHVSLALLDGDLYVVSRDDSFALRVNFREKTWVAEESKEKAYFPSIYMISAVVISEPSKVFAGRFVRSSDYGSSFQADFRRYGYSYVSTKRKYLNTFHYGSLQFFWIEPPTL